MPGLLEPIDIFAGLCVMVVVIVFIFGAFREKGGD